MNDVNAAERVVIRLEFDFENPSMKTWVIKSSEYDDLDNAALEADQSEASSD